MIPYEPVTPTGSTPRLQRPIWAIPVLALAMAGLVRRHQITLRPCTVAFEGAPNEIVQMFEGKVLDTANIESSRPREIVARFAGQAGPFSYRTQEIVRFNDRSVTFEHLEGPFHSCLERFLVVDDGDASTVSHTGEFTMPWGLPGWLFGITVVRPLFERLITGELDRMAESFRPDRSMRVARNR